MKQMKINVFEQIDKKIANNITSNYNDVVLILNQIYNLFVKIQLNYIEKLIT